MKYRFTENFDGRYAELDAESQQAIDDALGLFLENPRAKSLRTKKMQGYKGIFEMSANMDIRITYSYEKPDVVVLRNCGHHD
jgi:mRNA-degrading endonuclease YafQ of YafQ-DinJ toxin-antitoxin module